MKKLKIGLIAIALIVGGVQAYGGLRFTTYYCEPGIIISDPWYIVAANSPAFSCSGGTLFNNICTFSTSGSYGVGQIVSSTNCTVQSSYED
ncbi:hypothetical protein WJU16_08710 [Chitinophaga pollutisoli]|uniref:Secreted protein n=1 Tax=Chitinophaga pollutisoli TaxID=3133966 RepID=A0ABZ2YU40_9BACT